MPYRANYPATVAEVLNPDAKYRRATLAAVRAYARAKPWRGSQAERKAKAERLLAALAASYNRPRVPALVLVPAGGDYYRPATDTICLNETSSKKFSIITLLHEFGHALGKDERQTCRWSINLFARCFPRSFAGLSADGHCLRR
jgi:hypothetical protein